MKTRMAFGTAILTGLFCCLFHLTAAETTPEDRDFINNAAQGGMIEVKLGELAARNGASKEVKDFGMKMVEDHGKANKNLEALAGKKGWQLPTSLDQKHQQTFDMFTKMSGDAFDKAYIHEMVNDHENDVAEVKSALPKLSDSDLKAWTKDTLTVMEGHLQQVKGLSKTDR